MALELHDLTLYKKIQGIMKQDVLTVQEKNKLRSDIALKFRITTNDMDAVFKEMEKGKMIENKNKQKFRIL